MCQIMEELNAIAVKRSSLQIASNLLDEGYPINKISKCCKLTLDEIKKLEEDRKKLNS